jgi:transposase
MKAYSIDLRERIVEFVRSGGKKTEAARRFNVGRETVYRFLGLAKAGSLAPKPQPGRRPKVAADALRQDLDARPDATLEERGKTFGVTHVAIWKRLRKLGITLKKKLTRYAERDGYLRWLFLAWLWGTPINRPVYFLDECGVDHRLHRTHAWAPRGKKVYGDVPGGRRGRTSVISASRHGRLVCPVTFEGHCNRDVVEAYFSEALLPSIPAGSVIVLDNASFHCSPSTQAIVEAAGCRLVFLPPYSPDLNPIEHIWATLKRMLRCVLPDAKDKGEAIGQAGASLCV